MNSFFAEEMEMSGKRGIRLVYMRYAYDLTPWLINLILQQELVGHRRFPAAYQYLEATDERSYPIIRVVAAPGIMVLLQNIPESYWVGPEAPGVQIIRVQDPELVPPLAQDITPFGLTGQDEFYLSSAHFILPSRDVEVWGDAGQFLIYRLPAEVIIQHTLDQEALRIQVRACSGEPTDVRNAQARFAYELDPNGRFGSLDEPILSIVKTPAVTVAIAPGLGQRSKPSFFRVFEVNDINSVPPQGYSIVPKDGWREIRSFPLVPSLEQELARGGFDIALGFIPVVGDIVDIAELVYGVLTGRDRWGRQLTTGDLVIMGVGALLPFVGSAALRSGAHLLRRFGRHAQTAEELVESVRRASLSAEEADLIRRMESLIKAGRRPTSEMYEKFTDLIRRVHGDYPDLEFFMNAERTGFTHPRLQEAYQRYRQGKVRIGERPASPQDWVRLTRGEPRRILESLLGPDFARGTRKVRTQRLINVDNIPRPPGLRDAWIREHLEQLMREPAKLTERLGTLVAQRTTGGLVVQKLARLRIGKGHFCILKGNIGEILSLPIQRSILQKVAAEVPDARLITGLRMRLMTEEGQLARSVLFSDNIIAVERGGNLHILAVFEVKAGYGGGLAAQSQIFDWIEGRISDGSQLILPRGARILSPDGTERVLRNQRAFIYDPGRTDAGRVVVNLAAGDRHIIAGRGSSHLGIDSPEQVAAPVHRHTLDVSSAEMDYLTGQVIASSSW